MLISCLQTHLKFWFILLMKLMHWKYFIINSFNGIYAMYVDRYKRNLNNLC